MLLEPDSVIKGKVTFMVNETYETITFEEVISTYSSYATQHIWKISKQTEMEVLSFYLLESYWNKAIFQISNKYINDTYPRWQVTYRYQYLNLISRFKTLDVEVRDERVIVEP